MDKENGSTRCIGLLPFVLFIYICFYAFIDGVGFGRTAGNVVVKEPCAVADAELAGLAAITLADADLLGELVEDAFFLETGERFHETFVACAAGVYVFSFVFELKKAVGAGKNLVFLGAVTADCADAEGRKVGASYAGFRCQLDIGNIVKRVAHKLAEV